MHIRGSRFLFLLCLYIKKEKLGGAQKVEGGFAPECLPVATGLELSGKLE